jgi:hypothetical protein
MNGEQVEPRKRTSDWGKSLAGKVSKRKISDSEALQAQADIKRLKQPVLVTGVKFAATVTVIPPAEFGKLNIDRDRYQRGEVHRDVNTLITVLKQGGQIPAPIDVSERPDGSWWIVDGQQRFLAHDAAKMPIKAHIHMVESQEAEEKLFIVLNSRRGLSPRTVIRGWPGLFGTFIRRMNTDEKSPLRGLIDLSVGGNSHMPLDPATLLNGVIIVVTGTMPTGDTIMSKLPRADAALRLAGGIAWAEAFCALCAVVFGARPGARRARVLPVMALAKVAHRKYMAAGRPVFPRSAARLQAVNWETLVPSHARQYLPLIEDRIERVWR